MEEIPEDIKSCHHLLAEILRGNSQRESPAPDHDKLHTAVITKIYGFLKESIHLPGKAMKPEIEVSDELHCYRLDLKIFANGSSEESKGYVSLEFKNFNEFETLEGCIMISVIDLSNNQRFMQSFPFRMAYQENAYFLIDKYISRNQLLSDPDEFLPNGILTLMIHVELRNKTGCCDFHPCASENNQNAFFYYSNCYVGDRSFSLHVNSPLVERLSQESEVFKEMFELLKSEDRTETITLKKEEIISLLYMCPLLMGRHICSFLSVQNIFDMYISSDKYNIKSVMKTCIWFWKLYALVHGVKRLFECINKYESDLLKEILTKEITLISETNLDEELVKTDVDVTVKKPVYNRLWVYIHTVEPSTFTCNFYTFVDKNSDMFDLFAIHYKNNEESDKYDFYK